MKMQRRQFLSTAVAGTAGAMVAGQFAEAAHAETDPTALVPLGKQLKATRIGSGTGMGGWMRQTNQTRMGREKFEDLMAKCKEEGLIRAHGVSCHSIAALEAAAAEPWVDVVHARVNPLGHRTDGPMEQVVPVLKKIHDAGKGIIAMKLIGEGKFDAKQRDESLKFAMGLGCIDVMIVGFEKKEEVDDFKTRVAAELIRD